MGPQDFQDPSSRNWRRLGLYAAWDARVEARPAPPVVLWIEATNLLDFDYQTEYGYPDPGWQLWGGLRLELDRAPSPR